MAEYKTFQACALRLETLPRYRENLSQLEEMIRTRGDTELIVAPEVLFSGFDYPHLHTAATFSHHALKRLKKIVDKQIVVLTIVIEEKGEFVNQAVVIHRHKVIHRQNKTKLFRLGDEDLYFKAGKSKKVKPFEVNGVRLAILICFELRFKALWKQVEGADVVLIPARWGKERQKHLKILARALAVMNQCFVIVANSGDSDMAPYSGVIAPDGSETAKEEPCIKAKIDLRDVKKMRRYIVMR